MWYIHKFESVDGELHVHIYTDSKKYTYNQLIERLGELRPMKNWVPVIGPFKSVEEAISFNQRQWVCYQKSHGVKTLMTAIV